MGLFLGIDGGGSKTMAAVADKSGKVLATGLGGPSNFQASGVEKARLQVKKAIKNALAAAGVPEGGIAAAYFGMAGADRPRDFEIVRDLLTPVVPSAAKWGFENDAVLGLWAAANGVGVSVVCGTGTNVVAVNGRGERLQIGGMGSVFGDYAGGHYIGELAVARAMRGVEGRGPATALYDRLLRHYRVTDLLDLVDWAYEGKSLGLKALAPLVVEAAVEGDQVAAEILAEVGRELGISANAAISRLFNKDELVKVVAIGGVFQKSASPIMYDEFVKALEQSGYQTSPTILSSEPVLGALLGAYAQLGLELTEHNRIIMEKTLAEKLEDRAS